MRTSIDVLAGLIAVKELEIINLKDRIAQLQHQVSILSQENSQLYSVIKQIEHKANHIGFRKEDNNEQAVKKG